jgi:dTDP-4-dehydrorhamnose reductase
MNSKTLVLGGSSFVGRHLLRSCKMIDTVFTFNKNPISGGLHFDSKNMSLSDIISVRDNFQCAVILLGETKPHLCFQNPKGSYSLNVTSMIRLLDDLKKMEITPIFISTEFVYDGKEGKYSEKSNADPVVVYGRHKLEVESYIKAHFDRYLIFRLAKTYSFDPSDNTFFTNWLTLADNGDEIVCAVDQAFSPIYIQDAVDVIQQGMKQEWNGVYNLGAEKSYERGELLEMLLEKRSHYVNTVASVSYCTTNEMDVAEKWPLDVSMDTHAVRGLYHKKWITPDVACEKICSVIYNS